MQSSLLAIVYGAVAAIIGLYMVLHLRLIITMAVHVYQRQYHPERFKVYEIEYPHSLPDNAIPLVKSAKALGFHDVGSVTNEYPKPQRIDQFFIHEDTQVLLLIFPHQSAYAALFYSVYADGFTLQTAHPLGVNTTTRTMEVNSIMTSLDAAYDYHLGRNQSLIEGGHGPSQVWPDITAIIGWYTQHILQDVPQQLKPAIIQGLQTVLALGSVLLVLTLLYFGLQHDLSLPYLLVLTLFSIPFTWLTMRRWGKPAYLIPTEQRKKKKRTSGRATPYA